MLNKILILGGTQMIGASVVKRLCKFTNFNITLANRGITNKFIFPKLNTINIDRNTGKGCSNLSNNFYDTIIDFSCYSIKYFVNTIKYCKYKRYVLISSQGVLDKNIENLQDIAYKNYIIEKYKLEKYVLSNYKQNFIIIRPGAVYGPNDYTNRFEYKNNKYYLKNTNFIASEDPSCVYVEDLSAQIAFYLIALSKGNIINNQIINIP